MRKLPGRQVHLDFHTSPSIPGVGAKFDKKQFQAALIEGNVNSITVFAKCHHGYCYYPTKIGKQHPTMQPGSDLTGAMIDAAHEINVDAPIYITVGWSAYDAENHPKWMMANEDGTKRFNNIDPDAKPEDIRPDCSWRCLCPSGEYAQSVYDLTREIVNRYQKVDGLFYDIVYLFDTCYCPNCLAGMKRAGLDPSNIEDARKYYRMSHLEFMKNCTDILHEKHPEATIFFNSGGAEIYRPEYHQGQTHYEMEDLPTAWGGYNKMPPRASVMSRYGKEYLGMTGKFHTSWGEFGGYKNPDALRYEVLMMAMYGAKCSVGDQMRPCAVMDMETYKVIGHAYRALEEIEPWAYPAASTATLGVYLSGVNASDEGLHSMLLESHIDFEVVLPGDALDRYAAVILPDSVRLTEEEAARINAFIARGGAVVFSGSSAVRDGRFQIDAGVEYIGESNFKKDYFCPEEGFRLPFANAPFLCYEGAYRTRLTHGAALARVYEPWFERTYATYCSHSYAPYRDEPSEYPAAVRNGNVIYLAHPLCRLYKQRGAQLFREVVIRALGLVYRPRYSVGLPSAGRTRLTRQSEQRRYVFHAAYASPIQRGNTSVIEDIVPLHGVPVRISIPEEIKKARLIPQKTEISFARKGDAVEFSIPCLELYQGVELVY
ncbi:MAG: beta-galactosidase trimerization domain-containing protein [Clostridiales bacterium]|nr:beta-galactosidase trimerization domain-containing protein [Clostridiales bacterium]